jgi:uncharacterized membrane protein
MEWLVFVHIVSAILGIGPTYFGHILLRRNQQDDQLRESLALFQLLNYFPKIGGTIAVISGVALVAMSGWKFSDVWILISLVLYVLIQLVVIGMLTPVMSRLSESINAGENKPDQSEVHANRALLLARANLLYNSASIMGTAIIILMVFKPV